MICDNLHDLPLPSRDRMDESDTVVLDTKQITEILRQAGFSYLIVMGALYNNFSVVNPAKRVVL